MRKLSFVVAWCALITFYTKPAFGQHSTTGELPSAPGPKFQEDASKKTSRKPSLRVGHRKPNPDWKPSEPCTREDLEGPLVHPGVGASYIGGTIPGLHLSGTSPLLDPYGGQQLRRKGRLALSPKCLFFAFKPNNKDQFSGKDFSRMNLSLFSCKDNVNFSDPRHSQCVPPSSEEKTKVWVIAVPYGPIAVLSRGKYATSDLLSISTGYAVAAAGLLAALSQGIKNAHTLELSLGGATAGMLLYYYFGVLRPRLTENYLGIFIENEFTPSEEEDTDKTNVDFQGDLPAGITQHGRVKIEKSSDDLFVESDLIMFRVTNYHDYYNISATLNAVTGLTFVSENAEKPTK